jgi:hypothetical protein
MNGQAIQATGTAFLVLFFLSCMLVTCPKLNAASSGSRAAFTKTTGTSFELAVFEPEIGVRFMAISFCPRNKSDQIILQGHQLLVKRFVKS